ncbi:hypothetical protein MTBBW1_1340010 [Desulfamplus magnetovallimortis]|uniref:Uncharacterized protein n=1 Tax=Desulfamplus magnetovallimortis TaxID=1246637 RepID=A0A1W1H7I8_9BACT|nr:hypothetical protein MTBBW1_1340010 [Desulfamplus magnetovallimortis]
MLLPRAMGRESQSPLIGAVFLTKMSSFNREDIDCWSQSPLIGAVFLTRNSSRSAGWR